LSPSFIFGTPFEGKPAVVRSATRTENAAMRNGEWR
jgi:hypothetical protein